MQPGAAGAMATSAPALQPFTYMKTADSTLFTFNQNLATAILNIPIPTGMRLVTQHISVAVALQSTQSVLVHVTTISTATGSSPINNHELLLTPVQLGQGNAEWICSEPVVVYADGAQLSFTIGVEAPNAAALGTVKATATVSGFLVNP